MSNHAIRSNQIIKGGTFLIAGFMIGERCVSYIQNHLAPNLKLGEIVMMDNLAAQSARE